MGHSGFQPEHVARQEKGADLPPSVGKQLVGPDRAADDLVDIFRRFIFAVDFLVLPVGKLRGDETRMSRQGTELVGRGVGNRSSLAADDGIIERLGVHEPSPVRRMAHH